MNKTLSKYASFVVISHSLFAMPFAVVGYLMALADGYQFSNKYKVILIFICTFTLRNAAMAFNRLVDAEIDKRNPRTSQREIPQKKISKAEAIFFIGINVLAFLVATYFINVLCFALSGLALFVTLGYSYLKRITFVTHFVLGLGLSFAPMGAYLAVTEHFSLNPVLVSLCVIGWVAGFDILYALQDSEFDKKNQLHSIPAKFGFERSYMIAIVCELLAIGCLVCLGIVNPQLGWAFWLGVGIFSVIILSQFLKVKKNQLEKINRQFAVFNGWSSVLFCLFFLVDFLTHTH